MKKTKKYLTLLAFALVAYAVVALLGEFQLEPRASYLKYDPKDIVLVICGFIFGPVWCFVVTTVVAVAEWAVDYFVHTTNTGETGLVMNIISSVAFACTASIYYKKNRTLTGAIAGLFLGTVLMTIAMLAWNYILTPHFLGLPREEIAAELIPIYLPFNILKAFLNTAITLLIYKPIARLLQILGVINEDILIDKKRK